MNDKQPLEIKDLFHLERMERPTCGRNDCDCEKCPEHWVSIHPGPVLLALIHAAREALRQLEHVHAEVNDGEPMPWPETDALELALRPFGDIAEQAPATKGEMDFAPALTPEEKGTDTRSHNILRKLRDTIEATGGLHDENLPYQSEDSEPGEESLVPAGEREWKDLADVYLSAMDELGELPMIDGERKAPKDSTFTFGQSAPPSASA